MLISKLKRNDDKTEALAVGSGSYSNLSIVSPYIIIIIIFIIFIIIIIIIKRNITSTFQY